jgi:hypothetical protein
MKKGQKGRNMIDARKVAIHKTVPNIITVFSRYMRRAFPMKSLETRVATAKIPTSTPISF